MLWRTAFVFRKPGEEDVFRVEGLVEAPSRDDVKDVIRAKYDVYHIETIEQRGSHVFIPTCLESRCPN